MWMMNETFITLNHRLSSIEDKEMLCVVRMELQVHLIVTLLTEIFFFKIYFIVMFICLFVCLIYPGYPHRYYSVRAIIVNNWLSIFQEERYSCRILLVMTEIILTLVYMFSAFICTWFELLNTNYSVTPMVVTHWLLEASSVPFILINIVLEYFTGWNEDFFDQYRCYVALAILIKVPLFFLMRYAEHVSDFFINDLKMSFFDIFCKPLENRLSIRNL